MSAPKRTKKDVPLEDLQKNPADLKQALAETAKYIATQGGILAADESTGTITSRFEGANIPNSTENQRAYRELLFTTGDMSKNIEGVSGAILFHDTTLQATKEEKNFVTLLNERGIVPGIKVDKGVKPLFDADIQETGETSTQGMDDLDKRCKEYYAAGLSFAKWRAVLKMAADGGPPSDLSIHENTYGLARYAAIFQRNGLVPIVEPELLQDGNHTLEQCKQASIKIIQEAYKALALHSVYLPGTLLKPNMCTPGKGHATSSTASPEEIGKATVDCLRASVPTEVAGITFLSGGMSELAATKNLDACNKYNNSNPAGRKGWAITFSYGRALQKSVLNTWKGLEANKKSAQAVLADRAKHNGLASKGCYQSADDKLGSGEDTYVAGYAY